MVESQAPVLAERRFACRSPEATEALAEHLCGGLEPGSVVALLGELGSGKTCFVRGAARGLGVREQVTSPTYTLMHAYQGRLPVFHLDLWMQARGEAFLEDGGAEWLHEDGVALVEWAERVAIWLPLPRLEVRLEHAGQDRRMVVVRVLGSLQGAGGGQAERLAGRLAALETLPGVAPA